LGFSVFQNASPTWPAAESCHAPFGQPPFASSRRHPRRLTQTGRAFPHVLQQRGASSTSPGRMPQMDNRCQHCQNWQVGNSWGSKCTVCVFVSRACLRCALDVCMYIHTRVSHMDIYLCCPTYSAVFSDGCCKQTGTGLFSFPAPTATNNARQPADTTRPDGQIATVVVRPSEGSCCCASAWKTVGPGCAIPSPPALSSSKLQISIEAGKPCWLPIIPDVPMG
jgi:hypothetical protein